MSRFRTQFLLGIFFGVALPFLLYGAISRNNLIVEENAQVSLLLATVAIFASIVFSRRMTLFPGTSTLASVLPSFAIFFGIASVGVLVLRIEYSVVLLFLSFLGGVVTQSFAVAVASKQNSICYFVVPGGHVSRLTQEPEFAAKFMDAPVLPVSPNTVIVADLHFDHTERWERMLADAALSGIRVYHYKNVLEEITGRVRVEHLAENSFGSLLPDIAWIKIKRIFDVLACLIILPMLSPLLALISIMIKLDSSGPILFMQKRVGYRGRIFNVYKFRTMIPANTQTTDGEARALAKTVDNDVRITRLGRFLRKTRIDELPQMINILLGEMSWIGPRPEAVPLSEWYNEEIPFYAYRHIVRPGITGWAQVNQGHVTDLDDIDKKLQYDFYYIKNFSYWIDMYIIIRTAAIVVTGFGAK